ncbi:MAG: glycosyltransferase family 2 protein [Actinomycetota bacterium]
MAALLTPTADPTWDPTIDLADPAFPSPPTRREKYSYFGRQHRWLLIVQAISFILIAYSIARFATADTRLLLFLIPMSLYGVTLVISLLSSVRRRRLTLTDHLQRVQNYHPTQYPSVDVFLPSAGEPLDLLENTYHHVGNLHWPSVVTVHVLDDSARPQVQKLAEAAGFVYHTRPNRGYLKKAGNLRYGFEHSDGDFIAILDADFVPRPDYLHEMVPHFEDQNVGIVQSPQYFGTTPNMAWLQRCAGATQELFYRWIQPSRDRSKAAICVGTCAVYRRAALNKSGGFAQIGHSEDVHTGVNLMKVGYYVQYVPIVVTKGICPDDLPSFLNQQYRWCSGSMSLLADSSFHEMRLLSWRQRICFWAGFLYYISTGVNAFVAPLPALAMLWFLPNWVEPMNSIWLLGALLLWFLILPTVMSGRWRIDVLRVQLLYSFAHAVSIIHIFTGRTKEWVATGAASAAKSTPVGTSVSRVILGYVTVTQVLIYVGLFLGVMNYGFDAYWAMLILAGISAYVHFPVLALVAGDRWKAMRAARRARASGDAVAPTQPALVILPDAAPAMVRLPEPAPAMVTLPDTMAARRQRSGSEHFGAGS